MFNGYITKKKQWLSWIVCCFEKLAYSSFCSILSRSTEGSEGGSLEVGVSRDGCKVVGFVPGIVWCS